MFTGIISHRGAFKRLPRRPDGRWPSSLPASRPGSRPATASSVDGVCLSLVTAARGELRFDLSTGNAGPDDARPPAAGRPAQPRAAADAGRAARRAPRQRPRRRRRQGPQARVAPARKEAGRLVPAALRPFFVPKGSVAIDGVSLTVASLGPSSLEVELVPLTLAGTNLGALRPGAAVNLECDMVGKYVYNYLSKAGR
ncbi:MAG: hypothetical protein MZW92_61295 [Comamonadaceae bacterium]|nr:hypothetical protein [Comamonadaceae bacterium]